MSDALRLAELLCSRLCHDLAGPLAGLIGILEVAREEHGASEAVELAEQTAVELGQRLKLLRGAWGVAGEELDLDGLRRHADGLAAGGRLQVDLSGLRDGIVFDPPVARLILNLLLLAWESLPKGGTVALSGSPDDRLLCVIAGQRAAWPAGFCSQLLDETAALEAVHADARGMQAPLVALLARASGYRISMLLPAGSAGSDAPRPLMLSPLGS